MVFSISPNILCNTPNVVQLAGGLKFQMFLSKRISLDADLVFGRDYIHTGPGMIGLPLALIAFGSVNNFGESDLTLTDFLICAALIGLSFEHISYHVPVKSDLDISPYLSLLRYKYAYEYGNYSNQNVKGEQFSFALGLQLNKYFGRFLVSPYAECNIGYIDHLQGYNIGVYCGIYFPVKKN